MKKLIIVAFALFLGACSVPVRGVSSFALISDQGEKINSKYKALGSEIEKKECLRAGPLFLFWWGNQPIHESLLAKMLDEQKADVLLEANFKTSFFTIPYIYMQDCVSISGIPAVLK